VRSRPPCECRCVPAATITGRMSALAAYSMRVIDRIAAKDLDAFTLHDFRNGGAEFHCRSLPIRPMSGSAYGGSWNRNPWIGKAPGPPVSGSSDMHPDELSPPTGLMVGGAP